MTTRTSGQPAQFAVQADRLMSYRDIHEMIPALSEAALRGLQARRQMPKSVQIGRRRFWRESVIRRWIEDGEVAA